MPQRRPHVIELADALHEGTAEAVAFVDATGDVHPLRRGAEAEDLLGASFEKVIAAPLAHVHPEDRDDVTRAWQASRGLEGSSASVTFRGRHSGGHWVSLVATFTNLARDERVGALVIRIRRTAADAPTDDAGGSPSWRAAGLAGRNELMAALQRQLHHVRSLRDTGQAPQPRAEFTLVLVELRDFRRIRNTLPGPLVDQLVLRIAERFEEVMAPNDLLAYLDSGCFGVLLTGIGNAEEATRTGDRFARALDQRFEIGGTALTVSPMIGLATSERRYDSAEELFRDASSAIGKAARRRRRQVAAFRTGIRKEDRERLELVAEMSNALEQDEMHVAYQPIVRLRDRNLLGFEALARWHHPTRGEISPGKFIPLAEESGLIDQLGEHILTKACQQMSEWTQERPSLRRLTMSVNLSGVQLGNPKLVDRIEAALRSTGLSPEQLRLEMTESQVLEDVDRATSVTARLRLYGMSFSLDDFGTGHSSLALLHRLDYEVLKIDRSFLLDSWETNRKIVSAIISLAHSLQMTVVAEGVEHTQQAEALHELDCDAAQGFLYAKPLSGAAASRLIAANHGESG